MLSAKKSLEKQNSKPKCTITSPKLSIGMFSNQQLTSIISQTKQKMSKTSCELLQFRAETPNSPSKLSNNKFHFNSLSQFTKLDNYLNQKTDKGKQLENSEDLGDVSIRLKNQEDQQIMKILRNLKNIGEQINTKKSTQINSYLLLQWQNQLTDSCQKLIKILCPTRPSQHIENVDELKKQLSEEIKNRLLVEEQTSKIIYSQEQQIKSYIETIKQLEQQLLY